MKQRSPAKRLEEFLGFVNECGELYRAAYDVVGKEDLKLQDLLHEMEFAQNRDERNRVATKLQASRKQRRESKDVLKRNEQIVKFFEEQGNRSTLKRMGQLLGRQRTEEQYLDGKRVYKSRAAKQEGKDGRTELKT